MYSAIVHGGPLGGQVVYGPETSGGEESPSNFLVRTGATDESPARQWRYHWSEIWVGEGDDREFRGWRFDLDTPEGEEIEDMPGYEVRQIGE